MTALRSTPHLAQGACPGCTRLRVALLTCLAERSPAEIAATSLEAGAHLRRGEVERHYVTLGSLAQATFVERGTHYIALFGAQLAGQEDGADVAQALECTVERLARDRPSTHVFFSFDDFEGARDISAERRWLRQQLVERAVRADPRAKSEQRYGLLFVRVCEALNDRNGAALGPADLGRVATLSRRDGTDHGRRI